MNILHLVWAEIGHRKLSFAVALLAIALAVGTSVAALTLLESHQIETAQRVAALDDEIRKITKNMGFNINILPAEQNLADFYASDFAQKTMPLEFVHRLAQSPDVVKINHLRPGLIQKLQWPEQNRQIILMGVSGVVPFAHRNPKKPLSEPVPPGAINMGRVLADQLGLSIGSDVVLRGETFELAKIYPARGNKDDITVWIDLAKAQQMLDLPGRVNVIQALECNCASIDRLAEIQDEISGVLGEDVQVIELSTTAIARAKARTNVAAEGKATIGRLERLAGVVLPLVMLGAGLLVGLLALANVHQRRSEIGILRAVGVRASQILALFLSKAAVLGCLGAAVGYLAGWCGAAWLAEHSSAASTGLAAELFSPAMLLLTLAVSTLLAVLASWLPALSAAKQDPAAIFSEE